MKRISLFLFFCLLAPLAWCAAPPAGTTVRISVPGIGDIYLNDMTNLGSENEIVEQKIITQDGEVVRKIPGRLRWLDITFRRSLSSSKEFSDWRKLVEDGNIAQARKNIEITIFDETLAPVARWSLANAWPSAITCDQKPDGTSTETLRLVSEGLTRVAL